MDPEHIPILINLGVGGVLLFLYLRQEERLIKLTDELADVRREQWALIVTLVGEDRAHEISNQQVKGRAGSVITP